ncbi:MAG: hypothetical protein ACYCW6_25010 [Candidatus Xenobia bacterium]
MRPFFGTVVVFLLLVLPALAQLPGMPPDNAASFLQGHSDRWMGDLKASNGVALGHARVEAIGTQDTKLFVDATHLVPGGLYTVWYSDGTDQSLIPVGAPDTARANGRGELHLRRALNFEPVSNLVRVVLKYQPPGGGAGQEILTGDLGKG